LKLVSDGLLISPEKRARQCWKEEIDQTIATQGHEVIDTEWLNLPLAPDDDLDW